MRARTDRQVIPQQIDAGIAQKGHLWMDTKANSTIGFLYVKCFFYRNFQFDSSDIFPYPQDIPKTGK